ncbi:MAG: HAMP domain-containing histidine kinase [Elusimicrobia bacterium]|nr:HAMP domain-containing histidine kinase [Elusimicrobiota bacterium]
MRLTTRLSLMLTLLSTVVLGSTLGVLYFAERRHLLEQTLKEQGVALEKLARVCADSILDDNELGRLTYLKTLWTSAEPGLLVAVMLLDGSGRVLMHSDFLKSDFSARQRPASQAWARRAAESATALRETVDEGGRTLSTLSIPVVVNGRREGTAIVAHDQGSIDRYIDHIQYESLLRFRQAILVGIVLSLVFAFLLARTFGKPIQELSYGADLIGQGKLQHRIPAERSDELGDLARKFNGMAQKLAELDELKDKFLSQITHDLRNPLASIIGYVDMLLLNIQGPLTGRQSEALGVVLRNGNFLAELINNILDVTKLEAGRMEISLRETPLRPVVDSVIELMQVKADEFKVSLGREGIAEGLSVWSDEQALRRVLVNLVSNALKFTPSGGSVRIEWARAPDGADRLAVRDTGIGIPKDKLHRLFQKFSQIEETRNKVREAKGTGLGLVICKEIVEQHGGVIWVESEYQRGTSFLFTLPRRAAAPAAAAAHAG